MSKLGKGELWAIAAAISYAAQSLTLRAAAVDVHPVLGATVMAIPTFLVMFVLIVFSPHRRTQLNPRSPRFVGFKNLALIILGAVISYAVGNTLWVTSMALGGITVATPATQSGAVWSALLGLVLLHEFVTPRMVRGIALFSVGILGLGIGRALVTGASPLWLPGLFAGAGAALCWSITNVISRAVMLKGTDRFVALGTSITFGLLALQGSLGLQGAWNAYTSTPTHAYLFLVLAGLLNVSAQVSLISALGLTAVANVSMMTSAGSILSPLLGALLFADPLNGIMMAGIILVVWGAVLVQLGKLPPRAKRHGQQSVAP